MLRPHLNDFQRRLWLGVEAAQLGAEGTGALAVVAATGVAADTVRRGRSKAQEATSLGPEARGGRKRAEVHDAQLVAAVEALLDSETRGDPMSPLRWTNKSTQALARALTEGGHTVSDFVVRRLLKELG